MDLPYLATGGADSSLSPSTTLFQHFGLLPPFTTTTAQYVVPRPTECENEDQYSSDSDFADNVEDEREASNEVHRNLKRGRKPWETTGEGQKDDLTCKICNRSFTVRPSLARHMITRHSQDKHRFKCDICDRMFTEKHSLTMHKMSVHEGAASRAVFPCKKCEQTFLTLRQLKIHIKEQHIRSQIIGPEFRWACTVPGCERNYVKRSNLEAHILEKHTKESTQTTCSICNKRFPRPSSLKAHMVVHVENPVLIQCPECPRKVRPDILKRHLADKHQGQYKSAFCDRLYGNRAQRNRHDSIHREKGICQHQEPRQFSSENTYLSKLKEEDFLDLEKKETSGVNACKTCGAEFRRIRSLRRHQLVHSDFELQCPHCPLRFRSQKSLRSHTRKVHMSTPTKPILEAIHICELCEPPQQFQGAYMFGLHQKAAHSEIQPQKRKPGPRRINLTGIKKQKRGDSVSDPGLESGKAEVESVESKIGTQGHFTSFPCKLCPNEFKSRRNLNVHRKMTTAHPQLGIKLRRMIRRRTTEGEEMGIFTLEVDSNDHPWYICKQCGRASNSSEKIRLHQRIHINAEGHTSKTKTSGKGVLGRVRKRLRKAKMPPSPANPLSVVIKEEPITEDECLPNSNFTFEVVPKFEMEDIEPHEAESFPFECDSPATTAASSQHNDNDADYVLPDNNYDNSRETRKRNLGLQSCSHVDGKRIKTEASFSEEAQQIPIGEFFEMDWVTGLLNEEQDNEEGDPMEPYSSQSEEILGLAYEPSTATIIPVENSAAVEFQNNSHNNTYKLIPAVENLLAPRMIRLPATTLQNLPAGVLVGPSQTRPRHQLTLKDRIQIPTGVLIGPIAVEGAEGDGGPSLGAEPTTTPEVIDLPDDSFQCKLCKKYFRSSSDLLLHVKTHIHNTFADTNLSNVTSFKVPFPGPRYVNRVNTKKWSKILVKPKMALVPTCKPKQVQATSQNDTPCTGLRSFKCKKCHKVFPRRDTARVHLRRFHGLSIHNNLEEVIAPPPEVIERVKVGEIEVQLAGWAKKYMEIIEGDRPFKCKLCTTSYKSRKVLLAHVRGHPEAQCKTCKGVHLDGNECSGQSTAGQGAISKSTRISVRENDTTAFKCKECGKVFSGRDSARVHLRKLHGLSIQNNLEEVAAPLAEVIETVNVRGVKVQLSGWAKICMEIIEGDRPFKCKLCDQNYKSKRELKRHVEVHSEAQCEKCSTVQGANSVCSGPLVQGTTRAFKCKECDQVFSRRDTARAHLRRCHGLSIHKNLEEVFAPPPEVIETVKVGGIDVKLSGWAKKYMEIIEGCRPFKCKLCDKNYKSKRELKSHVEVHSEAQCEKCSTVHGANSVECPIRKRKPVTFEVPESERKPDRFYCDECGHEYHAMETLTAHIVKSKQRTELNLIERAWMKFNPTEQNPFQCKQCSESFSSKCRLRRHCSITSHSRPRRGPRTAECYYCNTSFNNWQELNEHFSRKPECGRRRKGSQECNLCGKTFPNRRRFLGHMSGVHLSERKYLCELCGFAGKTLYSLDNHSRVHFKSRQFKCDICKHRATTKQSLLFHRRTHTGEKPYLCDQCPYAAVSRMNLKLHSRRHLKEPSSSRQNVPKNLHPGQNNLDVPSLELATPEGTSNHINLQQSSSRESARSFSCTLCDKQYSHYSSVHSHIRLHHSGEILDTDGKPNGKHNSEFIHVAGRSSARGRKRKYKCVDEDEDSD